jgi:hypothetical protein
MRQKLHSFQEFTESLYPHEIEYLINIQNFNKTNNANILEQIYFNLTSNKPPLLFDQTIDKRTYSYLKNWIQTTLQKIDIDEHLAWLMATEMKVITDLITPEDEAELVSNMKTISPSHYNFIRFYNSIQYYWEYLMVRGQTKNLGIVAAYLNEFAETYKRLKELNLELNSITDKLVKNEDLSLEKQAEIEKFLSETYWNQQNDGYTRYRAVVRLTIYFYNNRQFQKLVSIYENLDQVLKTPTFYCKRVLANYYANRAMMHSKLNQLDLARKYGYLSIRNKNSDYLFYLVNLCNVLIKQKKKDEAYKLMQSALGTLKHTGNYYYKIGFVSFYVRTLLEMNKVSQAIEYASGFFEGYKNEIFEHRWHLFLSNYLKALIHGKKYAKALSLCRRYKLVAKEKQRIHRADYLPIIQYYSLLLEYQENQISKEKFIGTVIKSVQEMMDNNYRVQRIKELLDEMSGYLPEEISELKRKMGVLSTRKL